ncbi:alanine racemase [Anaerosolibacter carboniphilus]|uniref:Alanine racemase n=1 Tax=Anaerosolibacter carboniphilus TaxID=1417629 RepID=A0A841KZ77_9FIRM|nr:alanine racemase [Anaerosolibacter carboniphilus]MBB6218801.1 alanine racemase [Anaerosolibacter carboniphilus]
MLTLDKTRPVWAEINLDNLVHNMKEVRRSVKKDTLVTAVIKADGYGHGAVEIAETLLQNGADRLAVATLSEALELRKIYKTVPILVLGYTPETSAEDVILHDIIQTVYDLEQVEAFSKKADALNREIKIHIKIDTGMSRLGLQPDIATVEIIKKIAHMPKIILEGIFTHFAVADEVDKTFTNGQYEKFVNLCGRLEEQGISIPIKHVSNSAAIIDLPDMNLDMVRAGIMLYGLYPSDEVDKEEIKLKQVMTLKAKISHVKELEAGRGISYGLKYVTRGNEKIATLPIGYADGFTRMLSGKAEVIVKGHRVPVVGRICMDQCMIDVSGIADVKRGDEVILFGGHGNDFIAIDEIASKLGTINYEIVCMMGKRIPRVYVKNNEIVKIKDYVRGEIF